MKAKQVLIQAVSMTILFGAILRAQNTVVVDPVDPVDPLVDFTSLAEWNFDGDQEGWLVDGLTATVSGGTLSGATAGIDTKLILNPLSPPIPVGVPSVVTVEFQLTRTGTDTTPVQIFWSDNSGGFAEIRSISLAGAQVPFDEAPHVYRFEIRNVNSNLTGLRIDASQANGISLEFDYVRLEVRSAAPIVDPAQTVTNFTSLGEWNTDGDLEGWVFNNISSVSASGGELSGATIGNDPQLILNNLDLNTESDGFDVVEIRLRKEGGDTSRVDLFWADDNGNISAARRSALPAGQWPADGEFHVLQIPLSGFVAGTITRLRFDPVSDVTEPRDISLDYVRIGTLGPASAPSITNFNYDPLFREIEMTWTSRAGAGYVIESSPDLSGGGWTPAVTGLEGEAGSTTFLGSPATNDRFFRVVVDSQ
jgi:hypothetical protein